MTTLQEIQSIEERLTQLREEWKQSSPAKKKYIEAGAKQWTDKKKYLEKKLETEADLTNDSLFDSIP